MIYTTGTIAISGNTLTGTGTNFTAAGSLIRNGCTVIAMTSPVQVFQITAIGSATSLTVTPAANPAVPAGTRFAILLSDSLSVDGLAQDIAETFTMYQRYMSGFADVMNGTSDVVIVINGTSLKVPGQKSLAKKGDNNDITGLNALTKPLSISQGGTGDKTAAGAVNNLGLGAGAPAIGMPFFWPSSAMPNTVMPEWSDMVFLKYNGSSFSASAYPKLALVNPSLILPDVRGEFIRVWDDGRGIDSGRALLSAQSDAQQAITGYFLDATMGANASAAGAFQMTQLAQSGLSTGQSGSFNQKNVYFDTSKVVRTAAENRPRNIAFNLLVRAK
ncbi:tail fiber protein [Enterobacter hormaechei]|uniref:tail fiber protein n=2 Tax=Enterobacter hormaechei TaxID=158836 RepID=UPI001BD23B92|nr:tail fiber protein [Enterobacter hormaechei]